MAYAAGYMSANPASLLFWSGVSVSKFIIPRRLRAGMVSVYGVFTSLVNHGRCVIGALNLESSPAFWNAVLIPIPNEVVKLWNGSKLFDRNNAADMRSAPDSGAVGRALAAHALDFRAFSRTRTRMRTP
jgi:hypothetical protein